MDLRIFYIWERPCMCFLCLWVDLWNTCLALLLVELANRKTTAMSISLGEREHWLSSHTRLVSSSWARQIPESWYPPEVVTLQHPIMLTGRRLLPCHRIHPAILPLVGLENSQADKNIWHFQMLWSYPPMESNFPLLTPPVTATQASLAKKK